MSLGTFFRDYVYIPLGGSRCSKGRMIFNTFVVWALTGLWHGASWNFVIWGLWFFCFLMLERFFLKKWLDRIPVLSNLYLLVAVILGWVLFRFTEPKLIAALFRSLFGLSGNVLSTFTMEIQLQNHMFLLAAAVFACTPVMKLLRQKAEAYSHSHGVLGKIWDILFYSLLPVVLLLLSTACLVGDSYNPFIYFQF